MWGDTVYTFLSLCEIILHHHDCLLHWTRGPLRERGHAFIIQPVLGIVKWYSRYSINDCWIQLRGLSNSICIVCKGCHNTILQTGQWECLHNRNLFSRSSGGQYPETIITEPKSRGWQGQAHSGDSGWESMLRLFQLLALPGLWPHHSSRSGHMAISFSVCLAHTRTPVTAFRAHPDNPG